MYYIHKYEWEPGKYTHTKLLPGYNTHSEARLQLQTIDENKPHISYEIKKEEVNAN